jgi:alpha-ketoglutaric semialdehyde dehydrogenase
VLSVSGKSCIGYEDSATGDLTFRAFDPVNNLELPTVFVQASVAETELAVAKATQAFNAYANLPAIRRGEFLHAIAMELRSEPDALIHWFCTETGLSETRARKELERSCFQFESYADSVTQGYSLEAKIDLPTEEQQAAGRPDLRKMNFPLGPVVVFGSSNFPLLIQLLAAMSLLRLRPAVRSSLKRIRCIRIRASFLPGSYVRLQNGSTCRMVFFRTCMLQIIWSVRPS